MKAHEVEQAPVRQCPRCDGQGLIFRRVVKATGEAAFLCDECDAVWWAESEIGAVPWEDFETMMNARGLTGSRRIELQ